MKIQYQHLLCCRSTWHPFSSKQHLKASRYTRRYPQATATTPASTWRRPAATTAPTVSPSTPSTRRVSEVCSWSRSRPTTNPLLWLEISKCLLLVEKQIRNSSHSTEKHSRATRLLRSLIMTESTQILSTNSIPSTTVAPSARNQRRRNVVKTLFTARLWISRLVAERAVPGPAREARGLGGPATRAQGAAGQH